MRKFLIPAAALVILGGAYTAYWSKKAADFQQMLEQSITQLNEQAKNLNQGSPVVRYESIRTSGFPFAMTLEIVKPVIDVPASAILQILPQSQNAIAAPATPAPKEWIEEISYGQSLLISSNLIGNRFTFVASGDRTHVSMVDHAVRHTLVGSSSTPQICHLAFARKSYMPWAAEPLFTDLASFLSAFRSFDCSISGITLKDSAGNTTLFTADSLSVLASNEPGENSYHKLIFTAGMKAAKALLAYDPVMADYMQLVRALMKLPQHEMAPLSAYGEQDATIDFLYDGPTDKQALADPDMHLRLDINAFDIKNAAAEGHSQMHLLTTVQGDKRTASAAIHSNFKATELYDQLMAQRISSLYADMQKYMQTDPDSKSGITLPRNSPQEVAAAIMPKIHTLGTITFDVDAAGSGPKGEDFIKQGNLTVSSFDFIAPPYGIRLKGTAAGASGAGKMPTADFTLTNISFDAYVDDAFAYAKRVETLFATPGTAPLFTPELAGGIKRFVHGIAENGTDTSAKDLRVHLVMKDTGELTVSGKQLPEVLALYVTDITPYLPRGNASQKAPVKAP